MILGHDRGVAGCSDCGVFGVCDVIVVRGEADGEILIFPS